MKIVLAALIIAAFVGGSWLFIGWLTAPPDKGDGKLGGGDLNKYASDDDERSIGGHG